ncbi:hypothetical protein FACS1894126_0970 [Alphaproteobacteria bacterium]|nr:hypothetical protein FACS1894126_0970 [Alphaproteobacteria bacterium]
MKRLILCCCITTLAMFMQFNVGAGLITKSSGIPLSDAEKASVVLSQPGFAGTRDAIRAGIDAKDLGVGDVVWKICRLVKD